MLLRRCVHSAMMRFCSAHGMASGQSTTVTSLLAPLGVEPHEAFPPPPVAPIIQPGHVVLELSLINLSIIGST